MNTQILVPELLNDTTASRLHALIVSLNGAPTPPASARIEDAAGRMWPVGAWDSWLVPDGSAGVLSARTTVNGLTPGTRRALGLRLDGQLVASATSSTLPAQLPGPDEDPFVLYLGSCFCAAEDKSGRAGAAFTAIPGPLRPGLKLLCGDQVYLDSPFFKFLLPHGKQGLAETFLKNYANTWGQGFDQGGFQKVLSEGSNVFTSDDHEFWNNAPFPSFSVNTLLPQGRRTWWELARGLYEAFQTPPADPVVRRFDIGDFPILVADTRITRSSDRTTLVSPADMAQLVTWLDTLEGPAILVVGQPLFQARTGLSGNIRDWNFPDFDQYATLCTALMNVRQPMLILTGDVHFGRVASVRTPQGIEIIEVIASPLSLVTGGGARKWGAPPKRFPADPIKGLPQMPITPLSTWQRAADHFLTIELRRNGDRTEFRVRTWETDSKAGTAGSVVYENALQRRV